jgi:hypothetical protein
MSCGVSQIIKVLLHRLFYGVRAREGSIPTSFETSTILPNPCILLYARLNFVQWQRLRDGLLKPMYVAASDKSPTPLQAGTRIVTFHTGICLLCPWPVKSKRTAQR